MASASSSDVEPAKLAHHAPSTDTLADKPAFKEPSSKGPFDGMPGIKPSEDEDNVYLVDWDGPDDPANPKKHADEFPSRSWSFRKKWAATAIVSAFTFISPVSSSMIAPASLQVANQFNEQNTVIIAMMTSVFVLGYAFGPLILGPLSEIFGRSRVLQLANMWYLAWNLGCGFAQNKGQLIAFRLLAGLGGSAPLSIGGGVLSDLWKPEQRGQAIAVYSLAPLLGPVVGPIAGGWIAEKSTWRWVFWSTTIADAVVQGFGLIYLRETYAPILLEWKTRRLRKELGLSASDKNPSSTLSKSEKQSPSDDEKDVEKGQQRQNIVLRTVYSTAERNWSEFIKHALFRPFLMWVYEPIVQLLGLYMAFVYGLMYLFITTIPGIFEGVYHERVGIAGLHYLALGIGLSGASQVNARLLDRVYSMLKERNGGVGKPEFRLPSMFPATVLLPAGLFITGWTAQNHVFWLVPDIVRSCLSPFYSPAHPFAGHRTRRAGVILTFQSVTTYVIDAFTLHAASALAATTFLRSCAGFGFPLFAPSMFSALGYGKGDTILACVAIAIGGPA
ncbi:hypothetical protein EWM64_g9928 [Hericium alpestre]|uniref:Major facilitator superfamily (MFS) profile domain-containing protein n=1 Tax=Hericium alpestre TaxID=135208 RepID=A0A4Y9ZI36_9AGAM|nr:hypothetical protein EWM64_g9928 [Hericium alpestre]